MRSLVKPLTIILLLQLISTLLCFGQTTSVYYVSPEGDDADNGSLESPWRTINHSVSQLKPGDTLYLREGIYRESVQITISGAPNSYINIRNFPEENLIIDGAQLEGNGLLISASYLNISGLEISNWEENGIWVESSQYIEINNCTIHDVFYGIGFSYGSHDFKVKNCILTDFALYGFDASASGDDDCYNGVIENCQAFHGSDPSQNVDGFALGHGDQHGFTFINCVSYGVYDGFDISSDDTSLINCLAFQCQNAGYKIWGDNVTLINCVGYESSTNLELDWSGTPKTVRVFHSDFVRSEAFNIWVENKQDHLHIYNSVIACGDNIGLAFEDGYSDNYRGDYNLIHNWNSDRMVSFAYEKEYSLQDLLEKKWSTDTGQDTNSIIIEDPNTLFVDLDKMNLHPSPNSPLIDSADQHTSVTYDFESRIRPNGVKSDIGAYEYYENDEFERDTIYELPEIVPEDIEDEPGMDLRLIGVGIVVILLFAYYLIKSTRRV